jgi:RHS repeat-associated protein
VVDANGLAYEETYKYGTNAGSGAFFYTSGWQPTRVINRREFAQDTSYDGFYRPIKTISRENDGAGIDSNAPPGPNEPTLLTSYNKVHNEIIKTVLAEPNAGGDRTTYTFYDDLHRPTISLLDFDGDTNDGTPYEPNTVFVNDANTFTCDADDFVTRTEYDLAGNITRVIDRQGNATDTTYDGANRVIKVEQAPVAGGRPTTTTVYNDNGRLVLVTDPLGNQARTYYDARNRQTRSIRDLNGDGQFDPNRPGPDIVTDSHYDLMDNIIQTKDPRGNVTDTVYDRAYRPVTVTGPEVADAENSGQPTRPVTTIEYDKNGNVTKVIDPREVQTASTYDGLNRVISVTKAFGTTDAVTATTGYDAGDNIVSMTLDNEPAGLQTTTFTYDPFDRQVTETWPGGNLTTTQYYRNGLIRMVTEPNGQKTEFDYDRADRVVVSRYRRADNSIEETRSFTYDRMGNILTATDASGTTTYTYDALYRVLTESRSDTGQSPYTVTSTYDLNGNRTSCTYPQTGRVLTSTYDRANRLIILVDSGGSTTTYNYDKNGNITSRTLPNGVMDTFTFDALNRVQTHVSAAGVPNIYSVQYTYDLANNRRSITETVQDQLTRNLAYNYDNQYRLISESWAGPEFLQGDLNHDYDVDFYDFAHLARYWLASCVAPDYCGDADIDETNFVDWKDLDIIIKDWLDDRPNPNPNDYAYTYDLAGNRLTKTINGTATTCTYDPCNNELEQEVTDGVTTTYSYDENGNRIQKAVGGGPTTDYVWDVHNRLLEAKVDSTPVFEAKYDCRTRRLTKTEDGTTTYFRYDSGVFFQEVTGGTIQVEFIYGCGLGGGIGSILYSDRSGSKEYFCYNAVGHTVALTDTSASVVKTDLYEAFGNIISSTGSSLNNRLANTKERDSSIGLDNHGFRYYDPSTGRYISRDPAGYIDGLNAYFYINNNPINHIDPLGLTEEGDIQKALSLDPKTKKYTKEDVMNIIKYTSMGKKAFSVKDKELIIKFKTEVNVGETAVFHAGAGGKASEILLLPGKTLEVSVWDALHEVGHALQFFKGENQADIDAENLPAVQSLKKQNPNMEYKRGESETKYKANLKNILDTGGKNYGGGERP